MKRNGKIIHYSVSVLFFLLIAVSPTHAHAAIAVDVSGAAACGGGGGTCTQSTNATNANLTNASTTFTYSFAVNSSGTNRLLIVMVESDSLFCNSGYLILGAATTSSVTYGGQALTLIGTEDSTAFCTPPQQMAIMQQWYLINPPTGTNNLVVSLPSTGIANDQYYILSAFSSLTGVNQSTPIRGFSASTLRDYGGVAMTTLSSAINDLVWDSVCTEQGVDSTAETQQVILNIGPVFPCSNVGAATIAGAGSITTNWAVNGSGGGYGNWNDFATSIVPASSAPIGRIIRLIGGMRLRGGVRLQ